MLGLAGLLTSLDPGSKIVTIHYCFATIQDYLDLHDVVAIAALEWKNHLGSGSTNQHRFEVFVPYYNKVGRYHPRCYTKPPGTTKTIWNPIVPEGTLVIRKSTVGYSRATGGYTDKSFDSLPDRHNLEIAIDPAVWMDWEWNVAHELGHVLGLEHEHQRSDRDDYVNFVCSKLQGYGIAKQTVETDHQWKGITIEEVCKSNYLGMMHGLNWPAPFEFTTDMGNNGKGAYYQQTSSKDYDYDSIMHYDSQASSSNPTGGVGDLPLVRWKNGRPSDGSGPDWSNARLIPYPVWISAGDKKAIQFLYQWQGV